MILAAALAAMPARADPQPPTLPAAQQSFPLPGDGPWDYVTYDPADDQVFVGRFTGLQVVAAASGRLLTTIHMRGGDHGAVIAPDLGRLFSSDAGAHTLSAYAAGKLSLLGTMKLGGEPDGLAYDPVTHRVLALLPARHEVVAVDARTLHVAGRVDVGGEPEAGVADGHGNVLVTLRDRGEVIRIAAGTLQVKARWPGLCVRPSPVALDAQSGRLFVACHDARILVLDSGSGRVVATVPAGTGIDGLGFDPRRHLLVAADGDGWLWLLHADASGGYTMQGRIATARAARTMALDPAGGRVFTTTADIARTEPPTRSRAYTRLIPKGGTFRLIVVHLPPS